MGIVWFEYTKNQEAQLLNNIFNAYLPFMFLVDWILETPRISWEATRYLYRSTFLSIALVFCVGKYCLGSHIYPAFDAIALLFEFEWKRQNIIFLLLQMFWTEFILALLIYAAGLFFLIDWATSALNSRWMGNAVHEE